ncbi:hypothetical protein [Microbacterium sp. P5_E9]
MHRSKSDVVHRLSGHQFCHPDKEPRGQFVTVFQDMQAHFTAPGRLHANGETLQRGAGRRGNGDLEDLLLGAARRPER